MSIPPNKNPSWLPTIVPGQGPLYEQIAQSLIADILDHTLPPGAQLPSRRDLAQSLGVTVSTVSKAFDKVLQANMIEAKGRRGTRVRRQSEQAITPRTGMQNNTSDIHHVIDMRNHQYVLQAWPDMINQVLTDIAAHTDIRLLFKPSYAREHATHIKAGKEWFDLSSGYSRHEEQIIVTNGAQHGLLSVLMATCQPGDTIATERYTYAGLKAAAAALHLILVPVDIDEEGLIPDALDRLCSEKNIKALVCVPDIQNPTTSTLPVERRKAIASQARLHNLFVIEDSVYSGLQKNYMPPIASFAPDQTIRITSFSKALGTGLRIGYVESPKTIIKQVTRAVRSSIWMAPPIMGEVARELVQSGAAKQLLDANRSELSKRIEFVNQLLSGYSFRSAPSGPHVWLNVSPTRTYEFVDRLANAGIKVLPMEAFSVQDNRDNRDNTQFLRLSISAPDSQAILIDALSTIRSMLDFPRSLGEEFNV